uniref:Putative secreted protein n=1 Tax=Ixodes ricinus TaxID=34613 RepID=A0A6B0V4R9_IXORI
MRVLLLTLLAFEQAAGVWFSINDSPTPREQLQYDENFYHCPHDDNLFWPSNFVCDGYPDCHASDAMDEDSEICAPREYLLQDLLLTANHITNNSAFLTWSSGVELLGHSSFPLELSGYFLTGRSRGHTFQKTLEPTLTEYNVSCLKPWTEYNITLRRFYTDSEEGVDRPMRLGRAAALELRTHAYNPSAPRELKIISTGQKKCQSTHRGSY